MIIDLSCIKMKQLSVFVIFLGIFLLVSAVPQKKNVLFIAVDEDFQC